MKVVFVCTGNSCRSVMAEYLLNKMAADRGLQDWTARSCGTAAEPYFPTPEGVRTALKDRGIDKVEHTPELAGRELLGWADVVLTMARHHREHLLDQFPEFTDKTHMFLEHTLGEEGDVDDPISQPTAVYRQCRDKIEQALIQFMEKHASTSH
ncbi:MAG: low molecular weight protein arginine phosphatase [Elusimicrobiota bacterium]